MKVKSYAAPRWPAGGVLVVSVGSAIVIETVAGAEVATPLLTVKVKLSAPRAFVVGA